MNTSQNEGVGYLSVGEGIAGRYVVEKVLGEGAMGVVYLVTDTLLEGLPVALKLLNREVAANREFLKRFFREVEVTRVVNHSSVVRTYEVGTHDGLPFFTMEYCPSRPINQFPLEFFKSIDRFISVATQICDGLSAIHQVGILHRDLKPENVLVTDSLQVKIADFGVARKHSSNLTIGEAIIGSPGYLAPEVWQGGELGPGVDLYALGVILYELLTGIHPFNSDMLPRLMWMHINQVPKAPADLDSRVPRHISDAVMRLLRKTAEERFQTPEELKHALVSPPERSEEASKPKLAAPQPEVLKQNDEERPEGEEELLDEDNDELPAPEQFFSQFPTAEQIEAYERRVQEKRRKQEEKTLQKMEEEKALRRLRIRLLALSVPTLVGIGALGIYLVKHAPKQEDWGYATPPQSQNRGFFTSVSNYVQSAGQGFSISGASPPPPAPPPVVQYPQVRSAPPPKVSVPKVSMGSVLSSLKWFPSSETRSEVPPTPVVEEPVKVLPKVETSAFSNFSPLADIPRSALMFFPAYEFVPLPSNALSELPKRENFPALREKGRELRRLMLEKSKMEQILSGLNYSRPEILEREVSRIRGAEDELVKQIRATSDSMDQLGNLNRVLDRFEKNGEAIDPSFWTTSRVFEQIRAESKSERDAAQAARGEIERMRANAQGKLTNLSFVYYELKRKSSMLTSLQAEVRMKAVVPQSAAEKFLNEASEGLKKLESELSDVDRRALLLLVEVEDDVESESTPQ